MTMKEFAPAKINLFLDVIRKREDGYHDLGTVFQTVDVGDTLEFSVRDDGEIHLEYSNPQEYPVESDLVYKAAVALRSHVGNNDLGADIFLDKIMPLGAGLGVVAMMTDSFLLLPIIGLMFVVETSSSLIQLMSKKFFHKKVFISAPIHHHLEAKGWGEAKIVMRFWILAGVSAIIGVFIAAVGGAI